MQFQFGNIFSAAGHPIEFRNSNSPFRINTYHHHRCLHSLQPTSDKSIVSSTQETMSGQNELKMMVSSRILISYHKHVKEYLYLHTNYPSFA